MASLTSHLCLCSAGHFLVKEESILIKLLAWHNLNLRERLLTPKERCILGCVHIKVVAILRGMVL